jgi:hypothetical protein
MIVEISKLKAPRFTMRYRVGSFGVENHVEASFPISADQANRGSEDEDNQFGCLFERWPVEFFSLPCVRSF